MAKITVNVSRYKRLYNTWSSIKQRCFNKNCKAYKNYGARGIGMYEAWIKDFASFKDWALQNGYSDNLTIERIDNDKSYEPDNCTWILKEEQRYNQRRNIKVKYRGEVKCLSEWCRLLGLYNHYGGILFRITKRGMSFEEAISKEFFPNRGIDITGKRFGNLVALSHYETKNEHQYWLCKCDCGNTKVINKQSLLKGLTHSCGCRQGRKRSCERKEHI